MLTPPGLGGVGGPAGGRGGLVADEEETAAHRRQHAKKQIGLRHPSLPHQAGCGSDADEGRTRCISKFDEVESCRTYRDGRPACGNSGKLLSGSVARTENSGRIHTIRIVRMADAAVAEQEAARAAEHRTTGRKIDGAEVARAVDNFLVDNHAAVRINDAGRAYGLIVAQQANYYDIRALFRRW